jgi:cysteine desulfurase
MAIYLDHNAGAPIRPEVHRAIAAMLDAGVGNPSSVHRSGQNARRMLEQARTQVAALIGARATQIVFCSGGTEANNLAIRGTLQANPLRRRIISSEIEHSSVKKPLARLEEEGWEIVLVRPDHEGRIDPNRIVSLIDENTALVTLGLANSEVGTIQDFAPLAPAIARCGASFHIDASQAAGRIAVDVSQLGCDLMTLSGHKLGAPAGIGALFVREPSNFAPLLLGGTQERDLRAGTPNLIGAVGFGVAAATARERLVDEAAKMAELRDIMLDRLMAAIPALTLNSPRSGVLPNTLNVRFPAVSGETMLIGLDLEGVEVSMGSACAAGAVEPSHVLLAMGHSADAARSSLRLSLGYSTTMHDVAEACEIIAAVWRRIARPQTRQNVEVPAP